MSRVYKKPLYRPVPENATIITEHDGKNYACWNSEGKEMKAEIVESKNGRRIVTESEFYIARFTDANGRFRERSTQCRDQETAEHKLNTLLQEIEKVKSGIFTTKCTKRHENDGSHFFVSLREFRGENGEHGEHGEHGENKVA